jgi:hypothetical protein
MPGIGDGHLMAFPMQLSFKFPSPAHHLALNSSARGPRLKSRVPAGFFTKWCMLPMFKLSFFISRVGIEELGIILLFLSCFD